MYVYKMSFSFHDSNSGLQEKQTPYTAMFLGLPTGERFFFLVLNGLVLHSCYIIYNVTFFCAIATDQHVSPNGSKDTIYPSLHQTYNTTHFFLQQFEKRFSIIKWRFNWGGKVKQKNFHKNVCPWSNEEDNVFVITVLINSGQSNQKRMESTWKFSIHEKFE